AAPAAAGVALPAAAGTVAPRGAGGDTFPTGEGLCPPLVITPVVGSRESDPPFGWRRGVRVSTPAGAPRPIRDRTKQGKTSVKAGGTRLNHNESQGLTVRTGVRAGGLHLNHSEMPAKGLAVRTGVQAGGLHLNHSQVQIKGMTIRTGIQAGLMPAV